MVEKMNANELVTRVEFTNATQSLRDDIRNLDGKFDRRIDVLDRRTISQGDLLSKLAVKSILFEERFDRIEKTMMTKEDGQKIIDHIDAFAHRIETYDRKALVHDERLNNHETRLTRLENH